MIARLRGSRIEWTDRRELGLTIGSAVVTALGCLLVLLRVDEGSAVVRAFILVGLMTHLVSLFSGIRVVVGAALIPMLGGAMVDVAADGAGPRILTVVVGCPWFAGAQLGWEAIDRRGGLDRTDAAKRRWQLDNGMIIASSMLIGLLGIVGAGAPPVRTILLQAIAFVLVGTAALGVARRAMTGHARDQSLTD